MSPEQVQLLKALGSGVRPVDLGEDRAHAGDRFGALLTDAIRGRAATELGVTFAPSASGMFDPSQQERIARAVDLAAAAGSEHALILHERHTLRVDVRNRVVLEAPPLNTSETITGIDAFVGSQLPVSTGDEGEVTPVLAGGFSPARFVRNASLVRTLAQSDASHAT